MSTIGFFPGMPSGGQGGQQPQQGGGGPAWLNVISTLLDVGKGAYQAIDEQDKANAGVEAHRASSEKVVAADRAYIAAVARAMLNKTPADEQAVRKANEARAQAAQGLSPEAQDLRRKAVADNLPSLRANAAKAASEASASPKDIKKQVAAELAGYFVKAAQGVLDELEGRVGPDGAAIVPSQAKEGFLTRPVIGPVPGWFVLTAGVGVLGVLGYLGYRVYAKRV